MVLSAVVLRVGVGSNGAALRVRRRIQHDGVPTDQRVPVAVCPRDANCNDLCAGGRVPSTLHRARSTLHAACRVQLINGFGYTLPCYFVVSGRQSSDWTELGRNCGRDRSRFVQMSSGVAGASTSALRMTTTARRSSAPRGSTRSTWSAVNSLLLTTLVLFAVYGRVALASGSG